ncbi:MULTISPECIES: LysR family transcriptional regulator [unclassified Rhizobium]|jgi:DNA-binding transcriptional LysR family regulator|uniref:LysR family transcriptional regulator n=1 Tax=unclassified Rhizobium TaxID=2613769 RepID=UPI0006479B18|nr:MULTISPECIES: LysR family transcriptional regulator [unclassified Rhizobium]OJY74097.1 MAG: LysR family transcriptional regulator [Rhizobium sp. 60-20]RKD61475.1 DNA-binding transcriptional LysR family regulator [Rhizobium sp. WW_1]
MPRRDTFDGLSVFLAVAERGNFRAASEVLGVTPAAVGQAIQALERRLGLPLFHRTTRKVSLTEAGAMLLAKLRPAASEIERTLADLDRLRAQPSGLLRLCVHRLALPFVIEPLLPAFRRTYPEVHVEIGVEDADIDVISGGFDAGIRIAEYIEKDMIAVSVSPPFRWLVLGAPSYFATHGSPETPDDLTRHECIRFRFPRSRSLYDWEFVCSGRPVSIRPSGGTIVNDSSLLRSLAAQGMGLIYTSDRAAAAELESGQLAPCLENFAPPPDRLYLYFPEHSATQPKLRAFIDMAKTRLPRR